MAPREKDRAVNSTVSSPARLRLQVSLDAAGQPRVTPAPVPGRAARNKPVELKQGIRIYPTNWTDKQRRKTYRAHTIVWTDANGRRREKRATFAQAKKRAEQIALSLANGESALGKMTLAQKVRLLDQESEAYKLGVTQPEIFEAGKQAILLERSRSAIVAKKSPDVVEEYFQKRKLCSKWTRILRKMLDRFTARFGGPLTGLTTREVDDWLDDLKGLKGAAQGKAIGAQTRRNYREAIQGLVAFAIDRGYLPKDSDLLKAGSDPEPPDREVLIYTPAELTWMLNFADSYGPGRKLVPFICITAFAYVRHGEMNEEKAAALDWSNLHFKSRRIVIPNAAAKNTKRRKGNAREVAMPDNLIAWLQPYIRPAGKICELKNTSNALGRLRKKAALAALAEADRVANTPQADRLRAIGRGLLGPKKNALRKSCISYAKALTGDIARIADGAGNSPGIIKDNYLHVDEDMHDEALRWFGIMPVRADVLPLFGWSREVVTNQSPKQ